jgi:hypothetical protein
MLLAWPMVLELGQSRRSNDWSGKTKTTVGADFGLTSDTSAITFGAGYPLYI